MAEPAYLDVDQQQWSGGQIFLAPLRVEGGISFPVALDAPFVTSILAVQDVGAGGGSLSISGGPGTGLTASRLQYFQDGDGYLALVPIQGSTPVLGNGTDPPASGFIGAVNRTAQSAAVAATKLTDATPAGYYLVHYTLEDTTADIVAGTIQLQINYTDHIGATTQQGAALALTATGRDRGSFNVYLASGDISYQTNLVGVIGTAQYALTVRCTYLG